jgi:hypothetical protein
MAFAKRPLVIAGIGILAAITVVVVRLWFEAAGEYRRGVAAEARGDLGEAIRHWRDAGRAYLPGNPTTRRALDRLDALGVAAVTRGDYATARTAFEAERAALLGARSFYTPYVERLPVINRRLARLMAAIEDPSGTAGFEERSAWHEQRLAEKPRPKTALVLLALAGLVLWAGSAVAFFRKGLDKNFVLVRAPAVLAGIGFLVGLALFLACLRLA